jgi:DNA-binding beta-propeller fold protein YncE
VNRRQFLAGAVTLPIALRLSPEALAAERPVALVTADTQARVVVVELSTGKILQTIATPAGSRSIESVRGKTAVVCHTAEGVVSLIESNLRLRQVLGAFGEPRYTAAAASGRHAFVTDSGRHEVVAIDVLHGRVVGRVGVGGPARHVSIDPSNRTLWVSLGSKAEEIAVVDVSRPLTPRLVRRFRPPFRAHDVGFAPSRGQVWLTSGDRRALALYDSRRGRLLRRLQADAPPQHITFTRSNAYVTSGEDGTLRVLSLHTGREIHMTNVPQGSYNVQEASGRILTPSLDHGTLCILDKRGNLTRRLQVAPSSHDVCVLTAT